MGMPGAVALEFSGVVTLEVELARLAAKKILKQRKGDGLEFVLSLIWGLTAFKRNLVGLALVIVLA